VIYEKDLDESIARYQGETDPSIETCRKLAACLIVKWLMFGDPEHLPEPGQSYSFAAEPPTESPVIDYDSGTEFSDAIKGRDPAEIWPWLDDLMTTIQTLYPRLYDNAMRML